MKEGDKKVQGPQILVKKKEKFRGHRYLYTPAQKHIFKKTGTHSVYMCMYMNIYTYICTYTHINLHVHIYIYLYIYRYIYIHTYIHT